MAPRRPIKHLPADFRKLKRGSLRPWLDRQHPRIRRDVRRFASSLPEAGPLDQAIGVQSTGKTIQRLLAVKHKAYDNAIWLREPRRKRDRFFVFGAKHHVTRAMCYKLRAKAVRAGLFPQRVLHMPPSSPPFAIGTMFVQRPRNPYLLLDATVETFAGDVCDEVLRIWGFE